MRVDAAQSTGPSEGRRRYHIILETRRPRIAKVSEDVQVEWRGGTRLAHVRATPKASLRLELETGHYDETERSEGLAGWTGLEPAASGVTGRRSNQLNYHPKG